MQEGIDRIQSRSNSDEAKSFTRPTPNTKKIKVIRAADIACHKISSSITSSSYLRNLESVHQRMAEQKYKDIAITKISLKKKPKHID